MTLKSMPVIGKGFTLVELLVVVCIVGVLASVLFNRVLFYQEMAEKAAMQQVVGAIQSALVLQYGHRMTLGMGTAMDSIRNENPLDWLSQKPPNYAGEFASVKPATIDPGNWAFDKQTHELIYVPDHAAFFVPKNDGSKWIRYRTRFEYESTPGYKGQGEKRLAAVTFSPVEAYQWVIRGN